MILNERWKALPKHHKPDRVPLDYWATPEVTLRLMGHLSCATYHTLMEKLHVDYLVSVSPRYVGPSLPAVVDASLAPWREMYGQELRGVGGVNKDIFGLDRTAIDRDIERILPLVEMGGYIPCPDHRLPIEAKWENVQYHCDAMREYFK